MRTNTCRLLFIDVPSFSALTTTTFVISASLSVRCIVYLARCTKTARASGRGKLSVYEVATSAQLLLTTSQVAAISIMPISCAWVEEV